MSLTTQDPRALAGASKARMDAVTARRSTARVSRRQAFQAAQVPTSGSLPAVAVASVVSMLAVGLRLNPTPQQAAPVPDTAAKLSISEPSETRLDDANNGQALWSERYYRPFGDLFEIRDDIQARLATSFSAKINEARRVRDSAPCSRSVHAYDAFLMVKAPLLVRIGAVAARCHSRDAIRLNPSAGR